MTKRSKRHPDEFTDTDPRAMEVWLELLRRKTPGERIESALALTGLTLQIAQAGIRSRFPQADDREVLLRAAALRLPGDLIVAAYGWNPDNDGKSG